MSIEPWLFSRVTPATEETHRALSVQDFLAYKKPPHPSTLLYREPMPRVLWWSEGTGLFLMNEVPLYNPS